jgi:hypothetical protein
VGGGPGGEVFREGLGDRSLKQKEGVTAFTVGRNNRNEGGWLSLGDLRYCHWLFRKTVGSRAMRRSEGEGKTDTLCQKAQWHLEGSGRILLEM